MNEMQGFMGAPGYKDLTYYILDGELPKAVDLMTWAKWRAVADRTVEKGLVSKWFLGIPYASTEISTVFLGLDHNFYGDGPPLLFETMVFGGPLDQYCERTATWHAAEQAHKEWVRKVYQVSFWADSWYYIQCLWGRLKYLYKINFGSQAQ